MGVSYVRLVPLSQSEDGAPFVPAGTFPSADRCKTVARTTHRRAVGRFRFRIFDPADHLAFTCDGRSRKMDWRWDDLTARDVVEARDARTPGAWRPAPGEIVWFIKSMRTVRVISVEPGDRFDVERTDNGKALYATLQGLAPLESFSPSD